MPNEDSKLATELEQRLAAYIPKQNKENTRRTDFGMKDWEASIQTPTRSQQNLIQRQPYTGDG